MFLIIKNWDKIVNKIKQFLKWLLLLAAIITSLSVLTNLVQYWYFSNIPIAYSPIEYFLFNFLALIFIKRNLQTASIEAMQKNLSKKPEILYSKYKLTQREMEIVMYKGFHRIWYPIDKWIALFGFMQSEIAHLPQYVILFITGIIAYRKNWLIKISKKTGYLSLVLGIIMAFIVYVANLIPHITDVLFSKWAIYEAFMCIFLCFGLIVLFREKINLGTSKFRFLAKNSYAAYIFHFPVVLTVQYSLDKVSIGGAIGKFLIVSFLSVVITYFVAAIISKLLRKNNASSR